ncbi:MAG: hypothetical protein GY716_03000 [bacterium]|nr:hypothetical protein [bacterium]
MQHRRFSRSFTWIAIALTALAAGAALAADVTRPATVANVRVQHVGDDVLLSWDAVTLDVSGNGETVSQYKIYRGDIATFAPDKVGGSNLSGTSITQDFTDAGAAIDGLDHYYLISAVDADGNESDTKPSLVATPPVLSGFWTGTTIELDWTDAQPSGDLVGYRVYYGRGSGEYEFVDDVALDTSHTLSGLQSFVNWYSVVTAIDSQGNESAFSNEHIDSPNGIVNMKAHQTDELCWGAADCVPADPDKVQRANGWQLLVPVDFPEGDWTRATMTFTMESRLCSPPNQGTVTKCGAGNPCVSPPCNGGYNPCGDPWDRTAHVFVVLDDCVEQGINCRTNDNLELMRAITPFGTDAAPPDGTGVIPRRKLSLDITPLTPLLEGRKYVGVEIGHFVQKGHWVSVDFSFTENPAQASPKPPADGIEIIGFGGAPLPTRSVTIPATATEVKMRLFTTGHGGSTFCTGGSNNGNSCTTSADCPGGACNPCDEFCQRENRILVDNNPVWQFTPWRTDCNSPVQCSNWNACGFPSCTFPRAGWCPGFIACHHDAPCDNDLDFTPELGGGGTFDIDYNLPLQNGSWAVSLVLYWYN